MGDDLYSPTVANPKGFFENLEINSINEAILSQVVPRRPQGIIGDLLFRNRPGKAQLWLARVPLGTTMSCPDGIRDRICKLTAREPFCFKDPRFSYTLPCWEPMLRETKVLVVFRDPSDTAKSILKECRDDKYLQSLAISRKQVLEVWRLMYSHILSRYRADGSWLFLHFDQMLDSRGLDRLEAFAGASVDRSFPERSLKRSISNEPVPSDVGILYQNLCELATYHA